MKPLVDGTLLERLPNGARFALDDGWRCTLGVLARGLVRVLFEPPGGLREPRSWMVAPGGEDVPWEGRDRLDMSAFPGAPFALDAHGGHVVLDSEPLRVNVRLAPFALEWSVGGRTFAADRRTSAYQRSARSGVVRHDMVRLPGDRYYGLGDKTGPLDKHGRRLRTLALDALGYDARTGDPLYKHWPYLIVRDAATGIAYGVLYDTLSSATFDLGCEHDNYHGLYRYAEIEDGDLDYYLFIGPDIPGVVRAFADLAGPMAFGPRWSLGYANTAMSLADAADAQQRLSDFIDRAREHDIPISAFHFGSGYSSIGPRRYVFTWNRSKFPEPRELVDKFGQAGIRLVANVKPCLLDDHPAFAEVAGAHAFVNTEGGAPSISQFWDGQGAHVDFTNADGVRWWQRSLAAQLLDLGILGWNDNNEYEIWDEAAVSHGFGRPVPIARSRPLHPLLMTRATYEAQAEHAPGERVFTVTRAGPPGIQRYAQTWSGDNTTSWHTLKWNIRMGLSMSLSGMFNTGHDVGGFAGPVPDAELLVRWLQSATFSPRFIMNSWKTGGEVNSPWLHSHATPILRDWIRLRYRLMPYLYTLYARAARFGEPLLRPAFFDFPDDPHAWDDSDDYLIGPSLLVASVVEPGQRVRRVYLPKGPSSWFDFWSGESLPAGAFVDRPAPLDRIPLLVPAGAMIPATDTPSMARLHDEPSRALRIFPARGTGTSRFALYEDDGRTLGYRGGEWAEVAFEMSSHAGSVSVRATKTGDWALPYARIRVIAPPGERRRLKLHGEGVDLFA